MDALASSASDESAEPDAEVEDEDRDATAAEVDDENVDDDDEDKDADEGHVAVGANTEHDDDGSMAVDGPSKRPPHRHAGKSQRPQALKVAKAARSSRLSVTDTNVDEVADAMKEAWDNVANAPAALASQLQAWVRVCLAREARIVRAGEGKDCAGGGG